MALNENTIKGKWLEIRGEVQKAWGKLTNDELDKTKGDMKAVEGLIQQRYGKVQDASSTQLSDIYKKFEDQKNTVTEDIKKTLKN